MHIDNISFQSNPGLCDDESSNDSDYEEQQNYQTVKELIKGTFPLFAIGMVKSVSEFSKVLIISKLNYQALASNILYKNTFDFFAVTNYGLLTPLSPLVAQYFGRQNYQEIGKIVKQGWLISFVLSISSTVMLLSSITPILTLFGQDKTIISMVQSYSRVVSFACPAILGIVVDVSFLNAISKTNVLIPLFMFSSSLGVCLSYFLLSGKFNIPKEITSFGYAVLIESWLSWVIIKCFFLKKEFRPYKLFNFYLIDYDHFKQIFKLALPATVISLIEQLRPFLIANMIGRIDPRQLALNQAIESYLQFFTPLTLGIAQASQILVSQFKGKGDYIRMRRFGNTGVLLNICVNIIPLLLFCVFPTQLASNFISQDNTKNLGIIVRLAFIGRAVSVNLHSIQDSFSQNLNGLLDIFFPSFIQLLCSFVIIIPLSYFMSVKLGWEIVGIYTADCVGTLVTIGPLLWRWHNLSSDCVQNMNYTIIANNVLSEIKSDSIGSQTEDEINNLIKRIEQICLNDCDIKYHLIPRDKNCLFRAIALQANNIEENKYQEIIQLVNVYILDHKKDFESYFKEKMLTNQIDQSLLDDIYTIYALSKYLQRPIVVIHDNIKMINHIIFNQSLEGIPIFLYYTFTIKQYDTILTDDLENLKLMYHEIISNQIKNKYISVDDNIELGLELISNGISKIKLTQNNQTDNNSLKTLLFSNTNRKHIMEKSILIDENYIDTETPTSSNNTVYSSYTQTKLSFYQH